MDIQNKLMASVSEKLINEMESIYLSFGWRNDPVKVGRVEKIKKQLDEIFTEAREHNR